MVKYLKQKQIKKNKNIRQHDYQNEINRFGKYWSDERAYLCLRIMSDTRITCGDRSCEHQSTRLTYDHLLKYHNVDFTKSFHLEQLVLNSPKKEDENGQGTIRAAEQVARQCRDIWETTWIDPILRRTSDQGNISRLITGLGGMIISKIGRLITTGVLNDEPQ